MKAAFKTLMCLAMVLACVVTIRAEEDKKETKKAETKTLKGELGCAKCVFGIKKACTNAIKVKEGGKDVIYIFLDKANKEPYHGKICTDSAKGSVTGVVSKKGKEMQIKPSKDGVKFE